MPLPVFSFKHTMCPRIWCSVVLVGGAVVLSGCVVAPVEDGTTEYVYSSTTVSTRYGHPPPPRVEYRTVAPAPHYMWVAGDWFWTGSRYDWRPGRWVAPGYRLAPPPPLPPRPHIQPPRPVQAMPAPQPRPSVVRPNERPRPPQLEPGQRPAPSQMRPSNRPVPPQVRPNATRQDNVRPQPPRRDGEVRRPHRGDREDERRRP